MKILIDADGCPVTKSAIEIGNEFGIESIIFCDTSHQFNIESVTIITVGKGNDSADFALVNKCTEFTFCGKIINVFDTLPAKFPIPVILTVALPGALFLE